MADLEAEKLLKGDEKIIAEAKRRFEQCEQWEGESRKRFLDDLKFANADSDNGWQWPDDLRSNREIDDRPCLTINKTQQHNLQIINDAKQNKPSIKARPVGNGASFEAAQVIEGIFRHIEYISNAQVAYDTATEFQVEAGMGYWRVVTGYLSDDSFDQEIFIRRIKDPLSVYLDPDINEFDGSDARFGFVFDDMSKEEFEDAYPEYKDKANQATLGNGDAWVGKDHVRIAEYYRRVPTKDKLMSFTHPRTGEQVIMRSSHIPQEIADLVIADPQTKHRELVDHSVEWYLIAGETIVERELWPGRYIPIVRVPGREKIIEGKIDRKGHTRNLKDPQRMYNYWTSSAVEHVAQQGKMPWVAPAQAIEGNETYWNTANTENHSVLPYNHRDDDGNEIPRPERAEPPQMASAYIEGMKIAQEEMMMVSGQYEASFGEKSNERSGKAINERQRQGDNATYHFIDGNAIAIRYTGKIVIDLFPRVYDTPRVLKILAEDGTESHVLLDPNATTAYFEKQAEDGERVKAVFNPKIGKYDVEADIGPAYATRREEAFNAFSQIAAQNPELMNVVGDLLFKNADFPGADEIAERLERMVPSQAKGEGIPPEVQLLQGQLQNAQRILAETMQQLAEERLKVKQKEQLRDIEAFDAVTKRLETIAAHFEVTPKDKAQMLHDLMLEEHRASLAPVEADNLTEEKQGDTAQ